jgi:hypothetical protein
MIEIHIVPGRVYAASDGVAPQWRFLLVALNVGEVALTLRRVAFTGAGLRRAHSGGHVPRLIQGSRQVPPKHVLVLDVVDGPGARCPPEAINAELTLTDPSGGELVFRQSVPIEHRPTSYLAFPLRDEWVVANGRTMQHCLGRQFGFDLIARGDLGAFHRAPRRPRALARYASFGQPLLSPTEGVVMACTGEHPDVPAAPGQLPGPGGPGNHVIIEAEGVGHILLGHLVQGSLLVSPGERVVEGQPVGRVGNSGSSSQPHLHIEVLDQLPPDLGQAGGLSFPASGLPFGFRGVVVNGRDVPDRVVPRRLDVLCP